MTTAQKCQICHNDLMDNDRVIFSHHESFVFKAADVMDKPVIRKNSMGHDMEVSAAAVLSPDELRERRKDHLRTAIVNTFGDWGKMTIPEDAFYFRHQWCEPVRTASGGSPVHAINKHAIRFGRVMPGRLHG